MVTLCDEVLIVYDLAPLLFDLSLQTGKRQSACIREPKPNGSVFRVSTMSRY